MLEKIKILNLNINRDSLDDIVNCSVDLIKKGKKHRICVPNSYLAVLANENSEILDIVNNSEFVIPDGMPLVWYSKTFKKPLMSRIAGYDLFIHYCRKINKEKMSCFFLGSRDEIVVKEIIRRVRKDFSNIKVKGFYIPPFVSEIKGEINEKVIDDINKKKPDVVWVGLSAPKQEKWISDNIKELKIGMACGIGAVFDFYSNNIKRAPIWMQKVGLEWFYRILADPKRLIKRYIIYNTKFIFLIIKNIFKRIFKRN